jgi:ADP-heptose:LPS heptosyltransferase
MTPSGFPEFAPTLAPVNVAARRCPVSRERAPKRVLIARTIANGDLIMASPLLAALRDAWPDAHLTWVVERRERGCVEASPFLDELLLWDTAYWKNLTRRGLYPLFWLREARLARMLRERRYDVFVSLQPEDWSLLPRASGAPVRVGVFDTFRQYHGATTTSGRTRLYTHVFTHDELPAHRTDQYLLPLKALGVAAPAEKRMYLGYTADDRRAADRFLAEHGITGRFVAVAPTTGWPTRNWPGERYAALCDGLAERHGLRAVLLAGPGDREALDAIAAQTKSRPIVAAGAFGFRTLAALLARAALLVSGDTGPMHAAAAVGTPYLALFGPTPVAGRAPLVGAGRSLAHPVPCGPCDRKRCANAAEPLLCLRKIDVREALSAAAELLGERAPAVPLPVAAS